LDVVDAALAPVRAGDLLAGKYRIERIIGSGGMGVVVAARHEQLDQRFALKFLRGEASGDPEAAQRFLREARAAVRLKSEHVAKVHDVGTLETGAPYMVMEFLEGRNFAQVLEEEGPLGIEAAAEWIVQACEAVAEAHAAGIVHRDLKPQNLFLARSVGGAPSVKVLDFGVSKSTTGGALTQSNAMLGSPLYMSPEQMRSARDVDARSDVWALGVVLYELLTKRRPFEAESIAELCLKVASDPPAPITDYRADVPQPMVDVIARCLQKDPALRYGNAAELAAALAPMAPSASRILVERARMAVSSTKPAANGSPGELADAASGGDSEGRSKTRWVPLLAVGAAVLTAVVLYAGHRGGPPTTPPSAPALTQPPPEPAPAPEPTPAPNPSALPSAATGVDRLGSPSPSKATPEAPPKTQPAPRAPPARPVDDIPSSR
jgi:serine/threonine-protein kinase